MHLSIQPPLTCSWLIALNSLQFIRKVGVIQDFTSNGDVLVEYPEKVWRFNPAALSKVKKKRKYSVLSP